MCSFTWSSFIIQANYFSNGILKRFMKRAAVLVFRYELALEGSKNKTFSLRPVDARIGLDPQRDQSTTFEKGDTLWRNLDLSTVGRIFVQKTKKQDVGLQLHSTTSISHTDQGFWSTNSNFTFKFCSSMVSWPTCGYNLRWSLAPSQTTCVSGVSRQSKLQWMRLIW